MSAGKFVLLGFSLCKGPAKMRRVVEISSPDCSRVDMVFRPHGSAWASGLHVDVTPFVRADLVALERLIKVVNIRLEEEHALGADSLRGQFANLMRLHKLPEGD